MGVIFWPYIHVCLGKYICLGAWMQFIHNIVPYKQWPKYIDLKFVFLFQVFHEHDDGSSDYNIEHENLRECQFGTLMLDANTNLKIASAEKLNWVLGHLLLHPPTLLIFGCYQSSSVSLDAIIQGGHEALWKWSFPEVSVSGSCKSNWTLTLLQHWQD